MEEKSFWNPYEIIVDSGEKTESFSVEWIVTTEVYVVWWSPQKPCSHSPLATESVPMLVFLPSHHLSALWLPDASMEASLASSHRNPAHRASTQRHRFTNHCPGSCQLSAASHHWWPSLWICNVLVWHRYLFLSLCLADSCNGLPESQKTIPNSESRKMVWLIQRFSILAAPESLSSWKQYGCPCPAPKALKHWGSVVLPLVLLEKVMTKLRSLVNTKFIYPSNEYKICLCLCMCVGGGHMSHGVHLEIIGQFLGVNSLLQPWFWVSDSDCQACLRAFTDRAISPAKRSSACPTFVLT